MNALSHLVGFIFSIVGTTLLVTVALEKGTDFHYWSAILFSISNMFLFLSSTLYHSFFMVPSASSILQSFDHVGIYFLIAGSYTPFMLIGLHHETSAQIMLIIQWSLFFMGTVIAVSFDLMATTTTIMETSIF